MYKSAENGKTKNVWFGIVDVLIILILAGFICSIFLIDQTGGGDENDPHTKTLIFRVELQSPYDENLFVQEGEGEAVSLSLIGGDGAFGRLFRGDDGCFYVECFLSSVRASEDKEGLWYLQDHMLLVGTVLTVRSELADFSVTILSLPEKTYSESVGTTEAVTTDANEPEPDDIEEPDTDTSDTESDKPGESSNDIDVGLTESSSGVSSEAEPETGESGTEEPDLLPDDESLQDSADSAEEPVQDSDINAQESAQDSDVSAEESV